MGVQVKKGKYEVGGTHRGRPFYGGRFEKTQQGKRDADAKDAECKRLIDVELDGGSSKDLTVVEFRDTWEELYPIGQGSKEREPTTWKVYMERTKAFAAKYGHRKMRSIDPREARAWAALHPGTVGPLRTMFNDALSDKIIDTNPFAGLKRARARGRADLEVIRLADFHEILDAAHTIAGPSFRALCALAGVAAMREAETFAVADVDLHFAEQEIDVPWQYRTKVGRPKPGDRDKRWARPKNGKPRTIVLPPLCADALRQVPIPLDGPRRPTDGARLLLLTPTGKHFTTRSHFYWWNLVRTAVGRRDMEFHELKHYAASYMLNELGEFGAEARDIIGQLAHRDTDLLYNLYGHPDEKAGRERLKAAFARAHGTNVRRLRSAS